MKLHFIVTWLCAGFASSVFADELIIEPDMGRTPILNAIQQTQHSIDLVMYGFTDESLLKAILQKKAQGKTVKIILEHAPYKTAGENKKTITQLQQRQVAWQGTVPSMNLIHQKTLILDERAAMVMTFNFTNATFKKQRNFAILIDDPKTVKGITALFSADWNHVPYHNTVPNLIVSPDDSRDKLLTLINHANVSIQLYAQTLNDYQLVGALAKAARRGVSIRVLTSAPLREKQQAYLTAAGVQIGFSKKLYIHAKALLLDQQQAAIGSINLTRTSLDKNRELMVITRDPQVLKPLTAIFEKDWETLQPQQLPPQVQTRSLQESVLRSHYWKQLWRFVHQINQTKSF